MPPAPVVDTQRGVGQANPGTTKQTQATDSSLKHRAAEALAKDPRIAEDGFETSKVMALIASILENPSADGVASRNRLIKQIKAIYMFDVTNSDGKKATWFADMKKSGTIGKGRPPSKPQVTISISDRDLVDLATGSANPQKLFAAQRIKIRGNVDTALLVAKIISHERANVYAVGRGEKPKSSRKTGRFFGFTTRKPEPKAHL